MAPSNTAMVCANTLRWSNKRLANQSCFSCKPVWAAEGRPNQANREGCCVRRVLRLRLPDVPRGLGCRRLWSTHSLAAQVSSAVGIAYPAMIPNTSNGTADEFLMASHLLSLHAGTLLRKISASRTSSRSAGDHPLLFSSYVSMRGASYKSNALSAFSPQTCPNF